MRDRRLLDFVGKLKKIGLPTPLTLQRSYGNVGGRGLRVFLSSTFRDMQGEREILLKKYIPALRQLLSERGVYLTVVDLRWGVTIGQSVAGETVNICMSEVAVSQYFVSFLGHRGGWRPNKADLAEHTFSNFKFLKSYIPGHSVTDCEVIYGALGWGPGSRVHPRSAFFYFRDESFLDRIPDDERDVYEDADKFGKIKLRNLKRRIVQRVNESEKNGGRSSDGSKLAFVECLRDYTEPAEFAEHVYKDLLKAIERDYPSTKLSNPLDAEFTRHISFARPMVRAYIPFNEVAAAIDKYCFGVGGDHAGEIGVPNCQYSIPLLLHGPAGSGKSAAVANWLLQNKVKGFVLPHFIGCTSNSTDPTQIVRRILEELKRAFELEGEVPLDAAEAASVLPLWLHRACSVGAVIIIIDGLDELMSDEAQALEWLPARLPRDCRLVVTTLTQSLPYRTLTKRGVRAVKLAGLAPEQKKQAAIRFLDLSHKSLEEDVLQLIVNAAQTINPLFLRLTLEELKTSAVFETVTALTKKCLQAKDPQELCVLILARFEADFGAEKVSLLYSLIYVSRYGMAEEELVEILGMDPTAWSPFFMAVRETLSLSGGRLNIGTRSFKDAVRLRFCSTDEAVRLTRLRLIPFFRDSPVEVVGPARAVEELPFLLMQCDQLDALVRYCLDIGNVRHMLIRQRADLRLYWTRLGQGALPSDLGPRYLKALDSFAPTLKWEVEMQFAEHDSRKDRAYQEALVAICSALGEFLGEVLVYNGAQVLLEKALELERKLHDNMSRRVALAQQRVAVVRYIKGDYSSALNLYYGCLGTHKHLMKAHPQAELDYARTLVAIADVAKWTDDVERAKGLCLIALRIYKNVYGPHSMQVAGVHNKLAALCFSLGDRENAKEAKAHLHDALKTIEFLYGGDVRAVASKGDPAAAEALHMLGRLSVKDALATALTCFAIALDVYTKVAGVAGSRDGGSA